MAKDNLVKLNVSQRIKHPKWGLGAVTEIWRSGRGTINCAVKFDKGGPVGFAERATNDVKDLAPA